MEWREIEGYPGYEVSDSGLVRGVDRYVDLPDGRKRFAKGKIIKPGITNRGYIDVRISNNGKAKSLLVHRVVAQAFLPNPDNFAMINHLSGDKQDNRIDNLAWTNASDNAKHAYQTGLNSNCGCTHRFAVAVIDTITGEIYCTEKAFCDHYGINYNSGKNALNGIQPFPKSIDLSGHSFEKYTC